MENFDNNKSDELELREFVRRLDSQKTSASKRKLARRRNRRSRRYIDIPDWLWFAGGILMILAVILAGILLCKTPVLIVIAVTLLEAALGICLNQEKVWLHAGVVILNIILGFIFDIKIFMLLASIVYGISIILALKKQGRIGGY